MRSSGPRVDSASVRASDVAVRLGGDEFVILAEGLHEPVQARPCRCAPTSCCTRAKRERRAGCRTAALDETPAGDGVSGD